MRRVALYALLGGGLLTLSIATLAQEKKPAPRLRADCPQGECCLWRLGLTSSGRIEFRLDKPYRCPTGETARGSGFLELRPLKSTGAPCDEDHKLIPKESQLNAAIHPIRRSDDLNHLCGTFQITHEEKPIFEGDIELFHRVNTHHKPFGPDPCDRKDHLQGWLTGKGVDGSRAQGFSLRAMLVARTDPRDGGKAGYAIGSANLDGLVIRCKP